MGVLDVVFSGSLGGDDDATDVEPLEFELKQLMGTLNSESSYQVRLGQ